MTDTDSLVPTKLQVFYACVRCAPMTELKTLAGLVLLFGTAGWVAISAVFRIPIDGAVFDSWLLFLSGLLAIASFGQGWKQSVAARLTAATAPPKTGAP